jgi:hypothetical protein
MGNTLEYASLSLQSTKLPSGARITRVQLHVQQLSVGMICIALECVWSTSRWVSTKEHPSWLAGGCAFVLVLSVRAWCSRGGTIKL